MSVVYNKKEIERLKKELLEDLFRQSAPIHSRAFKTRKQKPILIGKFNVSASPETRKIKLNSVENEVYKFIKESSKDMPVLITPKTISRHLIELGVKINVSTVTKALHKLEHFNYIYTLKTAYGFCIYSTESLLSLNYKDGQAINLILI